MKRLYYLALGHSMLDGCSRIIATSPQEVEEFAAAGIQRGKIILRRNGVEVPTALPERGKFRSAQQICSDTKLVLFLGRLSRKKSPDLLLEAFAMLSRKLDKNKLLLVFAGPDEGGMKKELSRMAGELGIASKVRFCGPLFGDDKWAAYRDADLFVLPSLNENFGNAAGEAAAAGTPVIVTDQCGIAPLLAGVAGLVVRHEAEAIAEAMECMLVDPALYGRLASGCRQLSARLNWEQPAIEMENLYAQVAAESRGAERIGK
jgi:glycosyltransferase involved in cell wall biosynthesis